MAIKGKRHIKGSGPLSAQVNARKQKETSDLSVKLKGARREKLQFHLGSHNQVISCNQSYGSRLVVQTNLMIK